MAERANEDGAVDGRGRDVSGNGDSRDLEPFRGYLRILAEAKLAHLLRRRVDPSDIVQNTLLHATRSLDEWRGSSSPELRAWLRAILFNDINKEYERHTREKRDIRREVRVTDPLADSAARLENLVVASDPTPGTVAATQEMIPLVTAALESLDDDQRLAVMLTQLESLSYTEAAKILGRDTEAAVAGLVRRGLEKLRALLTELG